MDNIITSIDFQGKQRVLMYNTLVIRHNSLQRDFQGEEHVVTRGAAPHKQGSTGRVYLKDESSVYPSVFNMEWVLMSEVMTTIDRFKPLFEMQTRMFCEFGVNTESFIGFLYEGVFVFNPFFDHDGHDEVDPLAHYGEATLVEFYADKLHDLI